MIVNVGGFLFGFGVVFLFVFGFVFVLDFCLVCVDFVVVRYFCGFFFVWSLLVNGKCGTLDLHNLSTSYFYTIQMILLSTLCSCFSGLIRIHVVLKKAVALTHFFKLLFKLPCVSSVRNMS